MRKSLLLLLAYILPFVGCVTTFAQPVITLNPVATAVCGGGAVNFTTASDDPEATYSWEYYDGSIWKYATDPGLFSGIGTTTLTVTNAVGKDGWLFRVQAIDGENQSPLTPYVRLTVDMVAPVASLTGANRVATGNTVVLNGTGTGRNPVWVSSNTGNAAVNSSGVVSGVAVGSAIISYTISNSCGTSTDTQRMEIFSLNITPSFTLSSPQSISLCQNATAMDVKSLLHVADADEEQTLTWTQLTAPDQDGTLNITGATASSGGTDIAPGGSVTYMPAAGFSGVETFKILVSDGIASDTMTITANITSLPNVAISGADTVCNGSNTSLTAGGATSYTWAPTTGLSNTTTASVNVNSVTATIVYTVTGTTNGCTSTGTHRVNVIAKPIINGPLPSQTLCAGEMTNNMVFTGTGVTYFTWINTNSAIGLPSSGTGNVVPFTAVNTGTSNISGIIDVTPHNNFCPGYGTAYMVTVKPGQALSVTAVDDDIACHGDTISAIAFGGSPSGAIYTWSNNNTGIGLATSGTGNINSFVASNVTAAQQVATITVTPSLNGCTGSPTHFTVSVNPLPIVSITGADTVCNGSNVSLTASGAISYSWAPSTGLNSTTAASTTVTSATATRVYTVTGIANGCASTATHTLNVISKPVINGPLPSQTLCAGELTNAMNFTEQV